MPPLRRVILVAVLLGMSLSGPALAQEVLRIAAVVNDEVVSALDVEQRLRLIFATTNIPDSAESRQRLIPQILQSLIDERLQLQEATRLNIVVTADDLDRAHRTVESQNGLPAGSLSDFLASRGVDPAVADAQLRAQVAWQKVVGFRLQPTIIVGDDEVDAMLARMKTNAGQPEVRIREIFIAADTPDQEREARATTARLADQIRGGAPFEAVAREFSQGFSAADGGEIGWVPRGQLAGEIDAVVAAIDVGEVSDPIAAEGGFYLVKVVDRRIAGAALDAPVKLTLAQIVLPMPDGADAAARARVARDAEDVRSVVSCANIESVAQQRGGPGSGRLGTVAAADLPEDIRAAVTDLALDTASAPIDTGPSLHVLLVCERSGGSSGGDPDRAAIINTLGRERLSMLARRYLRDLRRDAVVDVRL
ncbi:MAG: peptidylprolyl isomerase [Alphaproteobacteria bacterium]|nr:peptidylprolyl isomerase [Alphaproteobacteria bacterium]